MGRPRRGPYFWNAGAQRYVDASGRFVPNQRELSVLEARINSGIRVLQNMTEPLISGRIGVAEWQQAVAIELRRAHVQAVAFGQGGWANVTPSGWGRVGNRLRREYAYLREFAQEIAGGQLSEAQIRARLSQYEGSIWSAYWEGSTTAKTSAGYTEERRVLQPAEHCGDCVAYAAQGWQPIGSLPEPGEGSECLHNCRCIKEYR